MDCTVTTYTYREWRWQILFVYNFTSWGWAYYCSKHVEECSIMRIKKCCALSWFRAPLCTSSGAQEYYTVVAACGISCCGFQVAGLVWSWGLCVRFAGCCFTGSVLWHVWCGWLPVKQHPANPPLHTRSATWKPQHEVPQAATTV